MAAQVASLPVAKSGRSLRSLHDVAGEWKVARKAKPDAVAQTYRAIGLLEQAGCRRCLPTLIAPPA